MLTVWEVFSLDLYRLLKECYLECGEEKEGISSDEEDEEEEEEGGGGVRGSTGRTPWVYTSLLDHTPIPFHWFVAIAMSEEQYRAMLRRHKQDRRMRRVRQKWPCGVSTVIAMCNCVCVCLCVCVCSERPYSGYIRNQFSQCCWAGPSPSDWN